MQLSRLSLVTLLLTSFSAAISLEETIDARDIVLAKAASEAVQKRNIEVRTPKPKKVKTGGGGDEDDDDDDPNSAASVHLNMALIAGAGAVAVAAMML
ncbi:hypothetical protein TWF106_005540 [Orbilia oligospora]|uniref:Uncharacterized protein n=1 Tax=Orbilia oligospora TaxID=2813651 RepID=A0A6G1M873_ORBOL|nr:hypothetical protein TWF788_011020 [Orbilia oligospora]KAF3195536.1 hypothetical protein TWF106_005540 [Orbilia oligospora]KAF3207729.1 hypothetical protein TWF679_008293 [Orbilia oligospora]KAF3224372.1 hypothetical protein TWF191_006155 [Orbilia oligospora]KAF3249497.1 hypothetical protein TWF192_005569 [Orbilia oligospora]